MLCNVLRTYHTKIIHARSTLVSCCNVEIRLGEALTVRLPSAPYVLLLCVLLTGYPARPSAHALQRIANISYEECTRTHHPSIMLQCRDTPW
jgi:hypothetical protein